MTEKLILGAYIFAVWWYHLILAIHVFKPMAEWELTLFLGLPFIILTTDFITRCKNK
jgi:hypothetical protein